MRKKEVLIYLLVSFFFLGLGIYCFGYFQKENQGVVSPLGSLEKNQGFLEKYSFEELGMREFHGGKIKLERILENEEKYTAYLFSFESDGKRVTGQANIPKRKNEEKFPVVVMLRGYVDDKIYQTGMGTRKPAGFFAENGFITLAPDFLGFGESDTTSSDILEDRFLRPVTVLNLLASIKTLGMGDPQKVVMWGHSNGGQIGLSVLEITQGSIPTTLWAPVTKGFPESVLTYMGQLDDLGLKVKARIDEFVKSYDPQKFSITTYFGNIDAPIQLHQGTADEYVPTEWSDEFVAKMRALGKSVNYFTYRGDDHNLKNSWEVVVKRDLEFFSRFSE